MDSNRSETTRACLQDARGIEVTAKVIEYHEKNKKTVKTRMGAR